MKKILSLILCLIMLAVCSSLIAPVITEGSQVSAATADEIKTNANEARFLNMLNHNFVYNADFEDADTIVNNATLALLDLRDSTNEDYIKDTFVKGFVKDMYGIEIADMSSLNADYPQLDGFVYIIPRGYTSYTHEIVSVEQNEDGSYTVVSDVKASDHDAAGKTQKAVSLFVKNEASAFGYNMIYCNIITNSTNI
ncbi:MAG: hypothetical protein IJZ21_03490 [Clostridia bacterium]|nr:hypothetical protein [Clostridia bacterium]